MFHTNSFQPLQKLNNFRNLGSILPKFSPQPVLHHSQYIDSPTCAFIHPSLMVYTVYCETGLDQSNFLSGHHSIISKNNLPMVFWALQNVFTIKVKSLKNYYKLRGRESGGLHRIFVANESIYYLLRGL